MHTRRAVKMKGAFLRSRVVIVTDSGEYGAGEEEGPSERPLIRRTSRLTEHRAVNCAEAKLL